MARQQPLGFCYYCYFTLVRAGVPFSDEVKLERNDQQLVAKVAEVAA